MKAVPSGIPEITKDHYQTLAAFRHALRRFLLFSQSAARSAGIPPQQHQALLSIKGYPGGDQVPMGELAAMLHLRHHSVVGLINRLERRRLVRRRPSHDDRRRVDVVLTAQGEALILRLSAAHLEELRQLGPELRRLLQLTAEVPAARPSDARHGGA
jgi:DNA-binding MarR family transcriptional regulator